MCSKAINREPAAPAPSGDREAYALGYSEREFSRLQRQAAFYRDLTEDVFQRARIGPGMKVLDLGCGIGDVSLIAGERVGPSGFVLGIDRSPDSIETASRRIAQSGLSSRVRFVSAELDAYSTDTIFDAVIGRFILMYMPDPADTLRRHAACLRPGGIMAFQEINISMIRSVPEGPLFRRAVNWVLDTAARAGVEVDMGIGLYKTFLAAGLPAPQMIGSCRVEAGPDSYVYDYVADTFRSMLPVAERLGVATAEEVCIESLGDRLREEALAHSACIMLPPLVGAWATKPV